jgi:hypothetical protein
VAHDRTHFLFNAELERELHRLASNRGMPFSQFVEEALRDFIVRNDLNLPGPAYSNSPSIEAVQASSEDDACFSGCERRTCRRRKVTAPAVVHTSEQEGRTGRYRVAELRDISSSGIGLRFGASERNQIRVGSEFEVLFQLAERVNPVRMVCRACRKVIDEAGIIVGAVFSEPFTDLEQGASASN